MLFKSGEDALKADRDAVRAGSRHARSLGFIENPWGQKTRQLVRTTSRLNNTHWGMIQEHAYAHISTRGEELDEGFNDDADEAISNPHAFIDLDW